MQNPPTELNENLNEMQKHVACIPPIEIMLTEVHEYGDKLKMQFMVL